MDTLKVTKKTVRFCLGSPARILATFLTCLLIGAWANPQAFSEACSRMAVTLQPLLGLLISIVILWWIISWFLGGLRKGGK